MENLESKSILGNFKISESVISKIVEAAAKEIPEVACMGNFGTTVKDIINGDVRKSVRIKFNESAISIDLCIKVLFGSNLKEVSQKVQKNVKETVQSMTNLVVSGVNITVSGLVSEKEECHYNDNFDKNSKNSEESDSSREKE